MWHGMWHVVVKQGSTILQKTIIPKKEYLETSLTLRGFKPVTSRIEHQFQKPPICQYYNAKKKL